MYNKEQLENLSYNELRRLVNSLNIANTGSNPKKIDLIQFILLNTPVEEVGEEVVSNKLEEVKQPTNYIETIKQLREQIKQQFLGLTDIRTSVYINTENIDINIAATIENSEDEVEIGTPSKIDTTEIQEEAKAIQDQLDLEQETDEEENDDEDEEEEEVDEIAEQLKRQFS